MEKILKILINLVADIFDISILTSKREENVMDLFLDFGKVRVSQFDDIVCMVGCLLFCPSAFDKRIGFIINILLDDLAFKDMQEHHGLNLTNFTCRIGDLNLV